MHLDEKSFRDILEGKRPSEVLLSHLSAQCERCEGFLASVEGPDLLDGTADRALLALSLKDAPLDELGFARLKRRLAQPARRGILAAAAGMAAGLALVVGLGLSTRGEEPDGLKGPLRISVELKAALRTPEGAVQRVEPFDMLPSSGTLLLRYHSTEAGMAALHLGREGAEPAHLGNFPLLPGTHDLGLEGELAGVSLSGESGPLTLWLVAVPGRSAPDPKLSKEAISSRASGRAAVGRLDVRVAGQPTP